LFPEGTRNPDAEMLPFKSVLYHLTQHFPHVELVPVYLDNARRSMPKGSMLPVPLICAVHFGTPIQVMPDETKGEFLTRARAAVQELRP
jgi:1-acyl-sn-glycerol-3-phosphate acyltransferase